MKRWKKYRREGIKIKLGVVYDQSKLLSMLSQKLSEYLNILASLSSKRVI